MFLIFFLIFVLMFTIFQNILIAGISLVLVLFLLTIYQFASGKKILGRKIFLSLFGGFLLAGLSFGIKERRYYGMTEIWKNGTMENGKTFVGSGIIDDISGQGKYIFSDGNDEYLLYSEKSYEIGNRLRLVGNFTPPSPSKIEGGQYRTISSGTFAVPIFSGSFDYAKWLEMKGWKGTIYEKNSIILDGLDEGNGIDNPNLSQNQSNPSHSLGVIKSMKKSIQQKIIEAYGKNKISGLILGMLIGDRSQIPETEYQQFIDSGLVHLVAVSGGNILMIVVFLQFALFFLPFYVRIGLILATIIGYSLVCGLDSSVFRAVLMGGMSMVALFRGREITTWRLLSISALIMLVINPYFLAYDTGFLLSYSAIIGLVYFDSIGKNHEKSEKIVQNSFQKSLQYVYKNYLSPSIGASIGIFPIIIFFMGQLNLVSILGNLLVLPIVPFVMIYGFLSIRLHVIFKRGFLLQIEKFLIHYIYKIAELLSTHGIFLAVSGLWVKYLILAIFIGIFISWRYAGRDQVKGTRDKKLIYNN